MATVINKNKTKIFRHEYYGHAKTYGHKVWVSVDGSDDGINAFIASIRKRYQNVKVVLNGRKFKATEITVFVYYWNRQPVEPADNWIADKVVEVKVV